MIIANALARTTPRSVTLDLAALVQAAWVRVEGTAGAVRAEKLELVAPHAAGSPASEIDAEVADGIFTTEIAVET